MYSVDTNIVFDAFNLYPRDVFPGYWKKFEGFIKNKQFFFHETVKDEICRREDKTSEWFQKFVPEEQILIKDQLEVRAYAEVTRWVRYERSPGYDYTAVREFLDGAADSWIVASAYAHGLTIISNETRSPRNVNRVKLPDVADQFEVPYYRGLDFFRKQGISFH